MNRSPVFVRCGEDDWIELTDQELADREAEAAFDDQQSEESIGTVIATADGEPVPF